VRYTTFIKEQDEGVTKLVCVKVDDDAGTIVMEEDEFDPYKYPYDGYYEEETPVLDVIELPTYEKIIIPKKFSDYFPMRKDHQYIRNRSIEKRLMSGIAANYDSTAERSCILWTKRTPYIAVGGKQVDCRKLIYDYCVGDVDETITKIRQTCQKQCICLEYTHLIKKTITKHGAHMVLWQRQQRLCSPEIKWDRLTELHRSCLSDRSVTSDDRPLLEQSIELPQDEIKTPLRDEIISPTTTPCNTPNSCDSYNNEYRSDSDLSYIHGSPDRSDIEDPDSTLIPVMKRKRDAEYQSTTIDNTIPKCDTSDPSNLVGDHLYIFDISSSPSYYPP
jgi:hypothetical protein